MIKYNQQFEKEYLHSWVSKLHSYVGFDTRLNAMSEASKHLSNKTKSTQSPDDRNYSINLHDHCKSSLVLAKLKRSTNRFNQQRTEVLNCIFKECYVKETLLSRVSYFT